MAKWYLNPDGTFPTDAEGKPMFVSEAQFRGACCNACQWRSEFLYDCETEAWTRVEDLWVQACQEDGTQAVDGCTMFVWGELADCEVDPRPDVPELPTDPLDCCAPCTCQEDLPDEISCTFSHERTSYFFGRPPCGAPLAFFTRRWRSKSDIVMTRTGSCKWTYSRDSGDAEPPKVEVSVWDGSAWGAWEDAVSESVSVELVSSGLGTPSAPPCYWDFYARGTTTGVSYNGRIIRYTGLNPFGGFSNIGPIAPGACDTNNHTATIS